MTKRIITLLEKHPWMTAAEIAKVLQLDVSCVSSQLKRMFDKGILERDKHCGPKGGYGYIVSLEKV